MVRHVYKGAHIWNIKIYAELVSRKKNLENDKIEKVILLGVLYTVSLQYRKKNGIEDKKRWLKYRDFSFLSPFLFIFHHKMG